MCDVGPVVAAVERSGFLDAYPSYAATSALDELRAKEYPALAIHTYLDFTAANLYASSQIAKRDRGYLQAQHPSRPSTLARGALQTTPNLTDMVTREFRAVPLLHERRPIDRFVIR